jgi:hypothetical protein
MSKRKVSKGSVKRGTVIMRAGLVAGGAPKAQRVTQAPKAQAPKGPVSIPVAEPKLTRKQRSAQNKAAHAAKREREAAERKAKKVAEKAPKAATKAATPKPKAPEPKAQTGGASKEKLYRTKTGKKSHRKGCRFLSKNAIECQDNPIDRKLVPCAVCKPHLPESMLTRAVPKATMAQLRPCKVCCGDFTQDVRMSREAAEDLGKVVTAKGTAFHNNDCRCLKRGVVSRTAPSKRQAGSKRAAKSTSAVHPLSQDGQAQATA